MRKRKDLPRPVILFKVGLAVLAALLLLGVSFTWLSYRILTQDLENREHAEVSGLVQRAQKSLTVQIEALHALTASLAQSNTINAIITDNEANTPAAHLDVFGVKERGNRDLYDFVLLYNSAGRLLHEDAVAIVSEQGLRNSEATVHQVKALSSRLRERLNEDGLPSLSGIYLPDTAVPLMLAVASTSSPDHGEVPGGLLIAGRFIDHAMIRAVNARYDLSMRLMPLAGRHTVVPFQRVQDYFSQDVHGALITAVDDYTNAGYSLVADIFAQPVLLLELVRNRSLYQHDMAIWRQLILSALGALLAVYALLLILLYRIVFRRMRTLSREVDGLAAVGHPGSRVQVRGNDEISWFAERLNILLSTLDACQLWQSSSEKYLQEMLDSIHCGVMVVDAQTRTITDINSSGAHMVGLPSQEITGKICHQFLCPAEQQVCPVLDLCEQIDLSERVLLRADGGTTPVLKSVTRIEKDGTPYLIESFIDISRLKKAEDDLKRSEAKYRRFFEENLAGCCIWTVDSLILDCNPAFARLLGYDTVEAAKEAGMLFHCYETNQREDFLALLETKKFVERLECTLRHLNGQAVYCVANIYPKKNRHGDISEIRGYFFDDTRRVLLERQKHQLGKMDALGALASGMAHDINNILASVKGNADLIRVSAEKMLNPRGIRAVQDIIRAGERAQSLASQVLAFSKPVDKPAGMVCLRDMLTETLHILEATLPDNVHLDAQIKSTGCIFAGQNELHQIIMNLCVNAVQAMQAEGGTLHIVLDEIDAAPANPDQAKTLPAGRLLRLRIEDTGCGIAPQVLNRIFEPFFTTKSKDVGTGLGLWLVQNHVNNMHGQITVHSKLGHGTAFTLTFPLYGDSTSKISGYALSSLSNDEQIFLIDANPFIREVCTAMVQQLGYSVQTFAQPEEILPALEGGQTIPDLLIIDRKLYNKGGQTLVQKLRAQGHLLPVLITHGKDETPPLLAEEISGLLSKPINMEELAKSIELALDSGPVFADNAR